MNAAVARRPTPVPGDGVVPDALERELRRMAVIARLEASRRHAPRPAGHFVRPAVARRHHVA